MTRTLFLLAAAALPSVAFGQSAPKLPIHGWARADFDMSSVTPQLTLGVAFPVSRVTAITVEGMATTTWAAADVGTTIEIGALYVGLGAGPEFTYAGGMGIAGDLRLVLEIPPIPLYVESWERPTFRSAFGEGQDSWVDRNLVLWTISKPLALGIEHDGLHAISAGAATHNRWGLAGNIGLCKPATLGLFVGYEFDKTAQVATTVGPNWLAAQATLTFAF